MNFKSNAPVYFQIAEEIEKKIFRGEYRLGQKLPSIRELGVALGVNPNTIVRVYDELEKRGIVYTESTSGNFVTRDEEKIQRLKKEFLTEKTKEFVSEMISASLTPSEITEILEKELK